MDPRFLDLYEEELRFMRDMGAEFALSHPKIAARLRLKDGETPDPYVERLLDGFAFLTARVRMRMDAEFPKFTESLLEAVAPNLTAPSPSAAILELEPDFSEGALKSGFRVPRGSSFTARVGDAGSTCIYRLAQSVVLRPIAIDAVDYIDRPSELAALVKGVRAEAAVRIRIRSVGAHALSALDLASVSLFLAGDAGRSEALLENIVGRNVGIVAAPVESAGRPVLLPGGAVRHQGFRDDEALIPQTPELFSGHRLLQEYFIFAPRFRFVELAGLDGALKDDEARAVDVYILLLRAADELKDRLDEGAVKLHCAPAANLFERKGDRSRLSAGHREHQLIVDRTRPKDFEIYAVTGVRGVSDRGAEPVVFEPLYAAPSDGRGEREAAGRFSIRRERSLFSERGYFGVDVYLGLHQTGRGAPDRDLTHLAVDTVCTNRALPAALRTGDALSPQGAGPVLKATFLEGPTPPRPALAAGAASWSLVELLSASHAELVGEGAENAAGLRRLLTALAGPRPETRRLIEGVASIHAGRIMRRRLFDGPPAYVSGLEIELATDPDAFRGAGSFTLAAVLEAYFARASTLNTATEFVLRDQKEERVRWPVRTGTRPTV